MLVPHQPLPIPQGDGSKYQWQNCVLAAASSAASRATVDAKRPKPAVLRAETGDTSGGVTFGQAADAVQNKYGVTLIPKHLENSGELLATIVGGRGAVVSIDTHATIKTSRRTNWFAGFHSVYVNDAERVPNGGCRCEAKISTAHWEYAVEDPGTTAAGYLRWSASLLYRAALLRTGQNGINIMQTRDTEGVSRTAIATGKIRKTPSKYAAAVASIVKGKAYNVVSTVTGGVWLRADGTKAYGWHKVKLADGRIGYIRGEALA